MRLFGDPSFRNEQNPALNIALTLDISVHSAKLVPDPRLHTFPDAMDGTLFGNIIGVGIHSTFGSWDLLRVECDEV